MEKMAAGVHMIHPPSWSSHAGVILDANLQSGEKRDGGLLLKRNQMLEPYLLRTANMEASSLFLFAFFRQVIKGEKARLSKAHLKSYWLKGLSHVLSFTGMS